MGRCSSGVVTTILWKTQAWTAPRAPTDVQATLHPSVLVQGPQGRLRVSLDIVPDEDAPRAELSAFDASGELLAQVPVPPSYRLTAASAQRWVDGGFVKPA